MINCTNCGHLNPEGASECEACYAPLPSLTSCPTCQASVPDDAFFCPQCGASLPRGVAKSGGGTPNIDTVPPTNVVAQEALGRSPLPLTEVGAVESSVPPTNVVHPVAPPADLPPTNVVHPPNISEVPPTDIGVPSDIPPTDLGDVTAPELLPTNVVHPPVADTLPPKPVAPPADLPPTNVVHPPEASTGDIPEALIEEEEAPTLVVSPPALGDVEQPVEPAPLAPEPSPPVLNQPMDESGIPPTMPPQAPVNYDLTPPPPPPPMASTSEASNEPPIDQVEEAIPTFSEMLGESTGNLMDTEVFNNLVTNPETSPIEEISDAAQDEAVVPAATTVQPAVISPVVGQTVIQTPPPTLTLTHERSGSVIALSATQEAILLGKTTESISPDVDVVGFSDSDVVSRRHAAILSTEDGYFIEDLGSSNGTYVNDQPVPQGDRTPIQSGDRICLGREEKVCFIFEVS